MYRLEYSSVGMGMLLMVMHHLCKGIILRLHYYLGDIVHFAILSGYHRLLIVLLSIATEWGYLSPFHRCQG